MHYKLFSASAAIVQAGVAKPVSATQMRVGEVLIKANKANASTVYVGPLEVTIGSGFPLEPGEAVSIGGIRGSADGGEFNLAYVCIIGATVGDSVRVLTETKLAIGNV